MSGTDKAPAMRVAVIGAGYVFVQALHTIADT